MRIPSNKIADVVHFFRDELKNTYEKDELETFIAYCFEEYLNLKRADIFSNFHSTISESELLKFNFAIKDLKRYRPIQYILGKADFCGLKFIVNQHVLIPRPETEELVYLIIKENGERRTEKKPTPTLPKGGRTNAQAMQYGACGVHLLPFGEVGRGFPTPCSILDIGTGSGCIPISLKKNIPSANVYALDISIEALDVAKQNAEINNVDVKFIQHDILSPSLENYFRFPSPFGEGVLLGRTDEGGEGLGVRSFDIIVSNPPYICISEKKQMQKNVLDYEPHLALFVSDKDPLLFYKSIADFALKNLRQNGKLYFEINQTFGSEAKQMLENKGFKNVVLVKDFNNNYRILYCNI